MRPPASWTGVGDGVAEGVTAQCDGVAAVGLGGDGAAQAPITKTASAVAEPKVAVRMFPLGSIKA